MAERVFGDEVWDESKVAETFEGEAATKEMRRILKETTGVESLAELRVGRPAGTARAQSAESVKQQFRYPQAWDGYVSKAMKREGVDTKSEYFRLLVVRDAQKHHSLGDLQLS